MLLTASLVGISLPTFLIGIILILVFSVWLNWLPSFGRGEVVDIGLWNSNLVSWTGFKSIILPSIEAAPRPAGLSLLVGIQNREFRDVH